VSIDALDEDTIEEALKKILFVVMDLQSKNARLRKALKGVIAVADRKTDEFEAAHAALEEK